MAATLPGLLALGLGGLTSPPGIVVTLLLIAVVIVIGRFVLAWAWRLVWIAIAIVGALWLLGVLGVNLGVL